MISLFHKFKAFSHSFSPQVTNLMEQGNPYVSPAVRLQFNGGSKPQTHYIPHDVIHSILGFKLPPKLLFELFTDPGELAFFSHFSKTPFQGNQLEAWRKFFIRDNSDLAKVEVQDNEKIPPHVFKKLYKFMRKRLKIVLKANPDFETAVFNSRLFDGIPFDPKNGRGFYDKAVLKFEEALDHFHLLTNVPKEASFSNSRIALEQFERVLEKWRPRDEQGNIHPHYLAWRTQMIEEEFAVPCFPKTHPHYQKWYNRMLKNEWRKTPPKLDQYV